MRLGVRAKLFIVSFVLILGGGSAAGLWLGAELRANLEEQVSTELSQAAALTQAMIETAGSPTDLESLDSIADRVSAATGARITIVANDGRVLGDSEFDGLALVEMDLHGDRPEILGARSEGHSVASRYSRSLQTAMRYVAVRPEPEGEHVVRAARRMSSVEATLGRVRLLLLGAGVVLLIFAVLMSALASWLMTREIGRVLETARAVAEGDRDRRIDLDGTGDLADLARSFNQILDDLQGTVAALATERDHMQAVLGGMNEPVLDLDPDQMITLCNRAAVEFLGLDTAPIGKRLADVVPLPAIADLDFDSSSDEPSIMEFESGHQRFLAQATRRRDGGGSVLGLHDIPGIRRLEKMRREFVANVSHELRTPVAVLLANSETLLDGALEEPGTAERMVEAIHRQTLRLGNLVSDLLDISRIEAGKYHLDIETADVWGLLASLIESMEGPAAARGTTLLLQAPSPFTVLADPKALEQILTNLLDNAIKYSGPGRTVALRVRGTEDRVRFEVQDDGPGIPRRHHARLFERFYRVDKGRSRGMGGTGLGLSIVKHLAEAMNGRVGYLPATPQGSIFWLELPRADEPGKTGTP